MALPKALQQQYDEAEAIQTQLNGAPEAQTVAVVETPAPVVAAIETPPEVPEVPEETWAHKYRTLQAKFDAEVPRLHAQLREINATMQQTLRDKTELERVRVETPQAPAFTDQDKEVYGEDLLSLLERSRAADSARIAELEAMVQAQKKSVGNVEQMAAAQAEERFFSRLQSVVPDWEQINVDAGWVEWLTGRFPGASVTRQEMLNASRGALDTAAVTELFQAYKATLAKPNSGSKELQRQVTPPKGGSASSAADTSAPRTWTSSEVNAALDPRRMAKMTPQERERVMAEIDAASAEGRILP